MKKKEIDEILYKILEIELVDGTKTVGQIVPCGNGYLLRTFNGDRPCLLEARHIKRARYMMNNFIAPDEEEDL